MKKKWPAFLLMLMIVPLAGELKFFPFSGEFSNFRVSLGVPVFLFFLLWLRKIPYLWLGFSVGLSVLAFRIILDVSGGYTGFFGSFMLHLSAFCYYIIYAVIFHLAKIYNLYERPVHIGMLSIAAEITASMMELLMSFSYSSASGILNFTIMSRIFVTAIIRSFFVLSFFLIAQLRHAEFITEQQREQNKNMLLLISSLYKEVIHLTKSSQNAEDITRTCYNLYKELQRQPEFDKNQLAQSILEIAGQVHEIKKDNRRIYASLTQLISEGKLNDYMLARELADIIVQSHQKYAQSLNKIIHFTVDVSEELPLLHVYTVLSIINNLVTNAVEAILQTGTIKIRIFGQEENIVFIVADDGPGIPSKKRAMVFKPGYTSKYNAAGIPSTGMGLTYIKELVSSLHGNITLVDPDIMTETVFNIQLPLKSLIRERWE